MFSRSFKRVGLHYTAFRNAIREDSRQTAPSRGVSPRKKFAVEANVESRAKQRIILQHSILEPRKPSLVFSIRNAITPIFEIFRNVGHEKQKHISLMNPDVLLEQMGLLGKSVCVAERRPTMTLIIELRHAVRKHQGIAEKHATTASDGFPTSHNANKLLTIIFQIGNSNAIFLHQFPLFH